MLETVNKLDCFEKDNLVTVPSIDIVTKKPYIKTIWKNIISIYYNQCINVYDTLLKNIFIYKLNKILGKYLNLEYSSVKCYSIINDSNQNGNVISCKENYLYFYDVYAKENVYYKMECDYCRNWCCSIPKEFDYCQSNYPKLCMNYPCYNNIFCKKHNKMYCNYYGYQEHYKYVQDQLIEIEKIRKSLCKCECKCYFIKYNNAQPYNNILLKPDGTLNLYGTAPLYDNIQKIIKIDVVVPTIGYIIELAKHKINKTLL